ncbi:MAG: diaminopropionate ammonia-lyase [Gammaproteobacteria bacterium]|nr:diaminopropionate ammonia-lyase [Gammaproteobacteria bacterium]
MLKTNIRLSHFANPKARKEQDYPEALKSIIDIADTEQTYQEISHWPEYAVTPLHHLDGIAAELNYSEIWYKDEASRFGLGSFKALGGAYAVFIQLKRAIKEQTGKTASINEIIDNSYADILSKIVVTCATDGNHGRSVAWGAKLFGCKCIIYIHKDVSEGRKKAMEAYEAEVIRISGNYDDSVKEAALGARKFNRIIVSDTSYEGYMEIPKFVALGYTVMLKEIIEQLGSEIPTHVFLQGGVGGLASAVCAYFWQYWGNKRPRLIIVEPETANCLQQSAEKGKPVAVKGDLETLMAGLACGEVSLLAWEILTVGTDDFITLEEAAIGPCMRLLASGQFGDPKIVAGESAVAGLASIIGLSQSDNYSRAVRLDSKSKVLVIGTEGDTDPELYQSIILKS